MIRLVCGPPAAGKTTYAHQHAAAGAVVLDADDFGSRDEFLAAEKQAAEAGGDVWVIRTLADPAERAATARRLGAGEVHVLATPRETALERAARDGRPADVLAAIDRWWSVYQPSDVDTVTEGPAMGQPVGGATPPNPPVNLPQNPAPTGPPPAPAGTPAAPVPPAGAGQPPAGQPAGQQSDYDGGKGGKAAILTELHDERKRRQALEKERDELRQQLGISAEQIVNKEVLDRVATLEAENKAAAVRAMRAEAMQKHGIKAEDAALVTGSTAEDIEAQCTRLAAIYGTDLAASRTPAPDPGQGARGGTPPQTVATGRDLYAQRHGKKTEST